MVKRVRLYPVTLADRRAMQEIARLSLIFSDFVIFHGKVKQPCCV